MSVVVTGIVVTVTSTKLQNAYTCVRSLAKFDASTSRRRGLWYFVEVALATPPKAQ